jgi:hypothetical protein
MNLMEEECRRDTQKGIMAEVQDTMHLVMFKKSIFMKSVAIITEVVVIDTIDKKEKH